ncbi:response regulator [candidate division FCPU426 bacterium]|nr:response regulator [candidate division FCPU426 bacterium]
MRILLADDDQITLRLLENSLKKTAYETVQATDGNEAWKILTTPPVPEIALLDWMMPGIDGTEICRRLRKQPTSAFIYIILITSNDRPQDITSGLDAGANDYIIKPFNKDELRSRVAVGARVVSYEQTLTRTNDALVKYSQHMELLAQERAQQLVQADRMISLGTMAAGIAHEINNPLTIAQGNINLLKNFWAYFGEKAYAASAPKTKKPEAFQPQPKDVREMIETSEKAIKRLRNIVDGMRSFSHGQGGSVEILQPEVCLRDAIQICLPKTKHVCEIAFHVNLPPFQVKANPVQITQILVNLISNAADALQGIPHPAITVDIDHDGGKLLFRVQDNGAGISQENLTKIWSPLFTTKPKGQGTGLGLAICMKIAQDHGGELKVESQAKKGTVFTLVLPNTEGYDRFLKENVQDDTGDEA